MMRPPIPLLLVAVLAALAAACPPNEEPPQVDMTPEPETRPDTLRGTVAVVGADPATYVTLRRGDAAEELILVGEHERALARLAGMEIWVEAVPAEGPIPRPTVHVLRYAVRAMDDLPAVDGVLTRDDEGRYVLRLADGSRRVIQQPPEALRHQLGARVWVAGPPDRSPQAYGIITPPPGLDPD